MLLSFIVGYFQNTWRILQCNYNVILLFCIQFASLISLMPRYFFNKEGDFNNLTSAAYHKKTHLLVTGFASGVFHLHELPDFNLIHSLRWGEWGCGWLIWFGNKVCVIFLFCFVCFWLVWCGSLFLSLVEKTPSLVVKEEYQNRRICIANTVDTWKRRKFCILKMIYKLSLVWKITIFFHCCMMLAKECIISVYKRNKKQTPKNRFTFLNSEFTLLLASMSLFGILIFCLYYK